MQNSPIERSPTTLNIFQASSYGLSGPKTFDCTFNLHFMPAGLIVNKELSANVIAQPDDLARTHVIPVHVHHGVAVFV